MRREWMLLISTVTVSVAVAVVALRWFAPELLAIPSQLRLVSVAGEVPPFFDGVFRDLDHSSDEFFVAGPKLTRARSLFPDNLGKGPTDLLGFRNRAVPNVADVITIGDSQTYGNNAVLERNWPSRLQVLLEAKGAMVYNMAVGGWAAPEYLEIFSKALYLKPRVIIVAFYMGNDPLESFVQVYGRDRWRSLRPDSTLSGADAPRAVYPPPESEQWAVTFRDGVSTIFTPQLRYVANADQPVIQAGYQIMSRVVHRIAATAHRTDVAVLVTIIPSKELVYSGKVREEGLQAPSIYHKLVSVERSHLERLATEFQAMPGIVFVDVLPALAKASATAMPLYPETIDSHPNDHGYEVIANALAPAVKTLLPEPPDGPVAVPDQNGRFQVYLAREGVLWAVESFDNLAKNGWRREDIRPVLARDVAGYVYGENIDRVDPAAFGPRRQP